MNYCHLCVTPLPINQRGSDRPSLCKACHLSAQLKRVATPEFWNQRQQHFESLISQYRSEDGSNYDCIIPASGGKDSYWQAYLMKYEYGMNPLLVTYHGNNYLPEGQGNLDRMREVLGIDHVVFGPGIDTLRRLNQFCFNKFGDVNWHARAGIQTIPVRTAVQFHVPLIVWGEIPANAQSMFADDDLIAYERETLVQQCMQGVSLQDLLDDGIESRDLTWLNLPTDASIKQAGVRGIYIGRFFKWEQDEHAQLLQDKFRFEFARQPFERTYCTMSNLDDMHVNGVQDYLNFVKEGSGHASVQASKDIRAGNITRNEAMQIVNRYDHVKPRRDLERWLDYVGMTELHFDQTADTFRNPRVWWIENGQWWKLNMIGEPFAYGEVCYGPELDVSKYRRNDSHHAA
jgi:N-acetyl sugar amidotransferase